MGLLKIQFENNRNICKRKQCKHTLRVAGTARGKRGEGRDNTGEEGGGGGAWTARGKRGEANTQEHVSGWAHDFIIFTLFPSWLIQFIILPMAFPLFSYLDSWAPKSCRQFQNRRHSRDPPNKDTWTSWVAASTRPQSGTRGSSSWRREATCTTTKSPTAKSSTRSTSEPARLKPTHRSRQRSWSRLRSASGVCGLWMLTRRARGWRRSGFTPTIRRIPNDWRASGPSPPRAPQRPTESVLAG